MHCLCVKFRIKTHKAKERDRRSLAIRTSGTLVVVSSSARLLDYSRLFMTRNKLRAVVVVGKNDKSYRATMRARQA